MIDPQVRRHPAPGGGLAVLVVVTVLAALAAPHAKALRGLVADGRAVIAAPATPAAPAIRRPTPGAALAERSPVLTALTTQDTSAALAGPVDRPQFRRCGEILAAPGAGLTRGGPAAGLAIRRQPPAPAAPVELLWGLALPAARAALGGGHAAVPAGAKAASSSRSNRSLGSPANS